MLTQVTLEYVQWVHKNRTIATGGIQDAVQDFTETYEVFSELEHEHRVHHTIPDADAAVDYLRRTMTGNPLIVYADPDMTRLFGAYIAAGHFARGITVVHDLGYLFGTLCDTADIYEHPEDLPPKSLVMVREQFDLLARNDDVGRAEWLAKVIDGNRTAIMLTNKEDGSQTPLDPDLHGTAQFVEGWQTSHTVAGERASNPPRFPEWCYILQHGGHIFGERDAAPIIRSQWSKPSLCALPYVFKLSKLEDPSWQEGGIRERDHS